MLVFGYGSLVNATTHGHPVRPARLIGWRRIWDHPSGELRALSIHPAPGHEITGVLFEVEGADLAALDAREAGYERIALEDGTVPEAENVVTYRSPGAKGGAILQSYLDVVMAGFAQLEALEHFFDTTDGWDRPILRDRARPRYPRAQNFDKATLARFDQVLTQHLLDQA